MQTWTTENDRELTSLLASHEMRERQDAARYRVIRDLIGSGPWPKDVINMARNGKDLDRLVDTKAEELDRIVQGVRA